MGFSISWVAFSALSKTEVVRRVRVDRSKTFVESANIGTRTSSLSLAEIPTGWTLVFSDEFNYVSESRLVYLSAGATVVACQAEEHIMFTSASCHIDSCESWNISHNGERGENDLSTRGIPPAAFSSIASRRSAFDTPIQLAAELTGFRHDYWKFVWGEPHFMNLEQIE